jgi:RNA polymerase sigma-70 factor (ECF subfamily)
MMDALIHDRILPAMTDRPDARVRPAPDRASQESAESSFDLLLRAKTGDEQAVDRLCARYLPRLRRWAHGRLPLGARGLLDTEDLAQEVLFHAVERVHQFEPRHEGAFRGYIRQTLLNRLRDEARKVRRHAPAVPLDDDRAADEPSPLELAIGREAMDRYEAALGRLKPLDREMVIARLELGFTAAELAAEFGKPSAAAAQMAVSRALVKVAEEMARA